MCSSAIPISSLLQCLLKSDLLNQVLCFVSIDFWKFFVGSEYRPLSDMYLANYFLIVSGLFG